MDKQEIFLELYEECRESLVRFARSMTRSPEEAKDLVQETTLAAYERFESLKNHKAFLSFLFTIASRIYKRQLWRRRLFFNFSSDENEEEILGNLVAPCENPEDRYDIEMLNKALKCLPDKQREAVILFEVIGLKMEEIADIQGGSVSGVKSRVQRGRKELEDILLNNKKTKKNLLVMDDQTIDYQAYFSSKYKMAEAENGK